MTEAKEAKKAEKAKEEPRRGAEVFGDCESCVYFLSDEAGEGCTLHLDEDEYALYALRQEKTTACPYYRDGDEYRTVRRQI